MTKRTRGALNHLSVGDEHIANIPTEDLGNVAVIKSRGSVYFIARGMKILPPTDLWCRLVDLWDHIKNEA